MASPTNNNQNSTEDIQPSSSVSIGSLKGASIKIHWTFFALLAFNIVWSFLSNKSVFRVMLYSFLFYGPFMLLSVSIHELGHAIATWKLGGEVNKIILSPIGGLSFHTAADKGHIGDLKVALAGPLMQLPLIGVLAILYLALKSNEMDPFTEFFASYASVSGGMGMFFITLCRTTFWYNVFLLSINLLIPIYPLDGLRIYVAIFKLSGMNLTKSANIAAFGGGLASLIILGYGVFKFFSKTYVGGLSEIVAGGLGFANSKNLYDLVKEGRLKDDPVLGRSCYEQSNGGVEMSSSSRTSAGSQSLAPTSSELV